VDELGSASSIVIAYEPVWAIGTGRAATAAGAAAVVAEVIRPALAKSFASSGSSRSVSYTVGL